MSARLPMPERFLNKGLEIEIDKIYQEGNIWYSKIIDPAEKNAGIEESKDTGI